MIYQILPELYLGDELASRDRELLEEYGITHIVNCAYEVPSPFSRTFTYLNLELSDPDYAFHYCIADFCGFIDLGRREGAVLVHCRMGLSRSPATILAYLCYLGSSLNEAIEILKGGVGRGDDFILPAELFLEQIRDYFAQAG